MHYTLELDPNGVKMIVASLAKAPYEMVAPLIADIDRQLTAQQPRQSAESKQEDEAQEA
jgi:hypothetical protein